MTDMKNTYVNPTELPDFPIGRCAVSENAETAWREVADPTVLYENGKWYLYTSCGMAWVSEDFCTWKHKRIEPYDCGYAPTVVRHNGKYLMASSLSELYVSDDPLSDFKPVGRFHFKNGEDIGNYYDPMIFSDDDGRLYIYYCIYDVSIHSTVVCGAELDPSRPTEFISDPVCLIRFDPSHVWERNGENNEDTASSAIEGPWMYKHGSTYYLVYSAPGTEYSSYALGAYKSKSPLGGFEYMKTSPFTHKTGGVVRGPGHGCIVDGPDGSIWVFYTCTLCVKHEFERMIGYDRVFINDEGDLVCPEISETPRLSPLNSGEEELSLSSLSSRRRGTASSCAPGRDPMYALCDDLMCWWEPAHDDKNPTLYIPLPPLGANVYAARIIWNEVGLSVKNNVMGGTIRYRLDVMNESGDYVSVFEREDDGGFSPVEYIRLDPVFAKAARLCIISSPPGITPGIYNISLFGNTEC